MKWLVIGIITFCVSLLFMLVTSILSPLQKFSVWSDWIKQNPIPKNCNVGSVLDVSTCIPTAQFAYYLYGNNLEYGIAKLFLPVATTFDADWKVQYVTSIMRAYAKGIVPGGFLTPYNLCCSIVPRPLDEFYLECVYPNKGSSWDGAKVVVGKTDSGHTSGNSYWDGKAIPPFFPGQGKNSNWGNSMANWKTFIAVVWGVYYDKVGKTFVSSEVCPETTSTGSYKYGGWYAKSNFLWQLYQIPHDSWMLEAFLSGKAAQTSASPIWHPTAMNPLLGISIGQTQGGGWVGFVREFPAESSMKAATVNTYIYASAPTPSDQKNAQNVKPKSKCDAGSVASGAFGGIMSGAGLGAMVSGPFAPLGALIGGILGGITGGVISGARGNCIGGGDSNSNGNGNGNNVTPMPVPGVSADDPTSTLCPLPCPAPTPSSEVSIPSIDRKYYNI